VQTIKDLELLGNNVTTSFKTLRDQLGVLIGE